MELSSLSNTDYILIKAHFEYLYRLRCDEKIRENMKRGYSREIAERTVRAEHSCNVMSNSPIYKIDSLLFNTCPCNFKHPHMDFFLTACDAYDKGILPFAGSLYDQPSYIIEAINLIQSLKNEYQIEMQEKANKGSK